jgi:hypothetical protein
MLRCEINKNIATQRVEIYLCDRDNYYTYQYTYNEESFGEYKICKRESAVAAIQPCFTIPYELWEPIKDAFKQELNVEKIEGSASHIKDLRWVLDHFMSKDKK